MSAPRVLLSGVVLAQPMGGVRRHNAELLPRIAHLLAEGGGSLSIMTGLTGREPLPFEVPGAELLTSSVPASPALARSLSEGVALNACLVRAREAGRPFELVHTAHLPAPSELAAPWTLTLHDLKSLADPTAAPLRRVVGRDLLLRATSSAAAVIAVSESLRAEVIEQLDVEPARVHVVPNAADHFAPLPRAPGPDAPILQVGHIEPRKNAEVVVRALALDASLPDLVLAGSERGTEGQRLRALATELGVAQRVHMPGLCDDARLAELYASAACVVFPSLREGFGIPALEAQRAHCPLAIADLPALVEVAGSDTPRFDPRDPRACAAALNAARAQSVSDLEQAARRAQRFSWDDSARRWIDVWRGLAG